MQPTIIQNLVRNNKNFVFVIGIKKKVVCGNPIKANISTSKVEDRILQ